MQSLHQELGETINLSVRHDDEVVYIERTSGNNSMMRVVQIIGARAPLHITAVGKIFLAEDGPEKCAEYARRTGLPRYTDNTLTDADALAKELEKVRRQGYASDDEEAEKGVSCIGAGIYNDDNYESFADPIEAARGADLVTTDVWTSMGFEAENEERKRDFEDWQVDADMMRAAKKDALFMHCLPAHRGEEVAAAVIDGPQSVVWDEAENRLHAQKALMEFLLLGRIGAPSRRKKGRAKE